MADGTAIIGRTRNDIYDFYETPVDATNKVLNALVEDGFITTDELIYEPCVGAGAMLQPLKEHGFHNIMASDIQDEDYIAGEKGIDVYSIPDEVCDVVFTNPPYNMMTKGNMLDELLRISKKKVILILNIFFLSSAARKEILEQSHLRHIYIHSDRVTMYPYGQDKPKNGGTKMYAWFVWDKEYDGRPTLSWI